MSDNKHDDDDDDNGGDSNTTLARNNLSWMHSYLARISIEYYINKSCYVSITILVVRFDNNNIQNHK
ncbi:hypothetical protein RB213_014048 [Colletotrichum asianum]